MRKALVLGVLGLTGTLASPAFADEFTGFRIGFVLSSDKLDGFYNHSVVNPPSPTSTKFDADRFGYSVFGGWALNKWLAFEAGYNQGSEFSAQPFPAFVAALDTNPTTEGSEYYLLHQNLKSAQASAVGAWWIGNKFSVFGRAGFMAWRGRVSYAYGDFVPPGLNAPPTRFESHASDDGFAPLFGVGIQTQLDHSLLRLEYIQADVGDIAFGSNFSSTDNTYSSLALSIVWTL